MSSKWRRYLYLMLDCSDKRSFGLHRVDASTLFLPTTNHKIITPTATAGIEDARLPRPFISFTASPEPQSRSRILDFFTLFGRGKNKSLIAGADENGFTFIYDLSQQIVYNQRCLNEPKLFERAVSLAVGDALYVMNRRPLMESRCGFESLVYDGEPSPKYLENTEDWRWRCLEPPPPYVLDTGYKPTRITAYTVVDDSHIWISMLGMGTYSFDTLAGTWSKAGKWVLPFRDRAHYIPECDSWLGFSSKTGLLCSSDLKTASARTRPVVSGVLEEAMPEFDGCNLIDPYLVHLGSGKFCVAKFFQRVYNQVSKDGFACVQHENFVILTGFVMDLDGPGGVLRMRKHKSRRYMIPTMGLGGWLF